MIYWTLGNFLKPLSSINLPKSPTDLGNFCAGAKIFNFSSEIIFGQLLWTFGDFSLVTLVTRNNNDRLHTPAFTNRKHEISWTMDNLMGKQSTIVLGKCYFLSGLTLITYIGYTVYTIDMTTNCNQAIIHVKFRALFRYLS